MLVCIDMKPGWRKSGSEKVGRTALDNRLIGVQGTAFPGVESGSEYICCKTRSETLYSIWTSWTLFYHFSITVAALRSLFMTAAAMSPSSSMPST